MLNFTRFFKVFICINLLCLGVTQSFAAGGHGSPTGQQNWDMDSDGNADALTDGLLMLRYTFDLQGEALTASAISTGSTLTSAEVEARIASMMAIADIDGNNQVDALTDGLLLLRSLFDLTGDSLISGAVGNGATRTTESQIGQYIDTYMPGQAPVDSDGDGVADGLDAFPN
ncbi:MAG: hypothetical protein ACPG57_04955, partial [Porticoccaceae bacterium]